MTHRLSLGSIFLLVPLMLILSSCKNKDNVLAPPPAGPAWLTFRHATTPGLLDDNINGISLGAGGNIWVATDSGASDFSIGNWGYIRDTLAYPIFSSGGTVASYKVNAVAPGRDGSVWFGLSGGGVKRYHQGASFYVWQSYTEPDIAFGTVSALCSDLYKYGDIWVATPVNGISRYTPSITTEDQGSWTQYSTSNVPELLTDRIVSAAYNDFDNTVWFGSYLGVNAYSSISGWSKIQLPADQKGTIVSIWFDKERYVWLAKSAGTSLGVSRYDRVTTDFTSYTNLTTGGQLPDGGVTAVTGDLADTHWFGTNAGLARLKDTTWTTFTTANTPGLPGDVITSLLIDRKGNLWIGTTTGIAVFNPTGTRF